MNDFKRRDQFGTKRFGGKPPFQRPGGGFGRPQLPMFPAVCAQCGRSTEVPFRPDGQRPIYCRDCLGGNKTPAPSRPQPTFRAPDRAVAQSRMPTPDTRIDEIVRNVAKMQVKLDQILLEIAVAKAQSGANATVTKKKKLSKKK